MTAQISVYGRLVDDPQTKQTSKGIPMTLARMAVSLPCSRMTVRRRCGYLSWRLADKPTRWQSITKANS